VVNKGNKKIKKKTKNKNRLAIVRHYKRYELIKVSSYLANRGFMTFVI